MILSPQAEFVMQIWMPIVVFGFFRFLPPRRAVIVSFLIAWLFLPQRASFIFLGLPDYDRMSATCYSILLATLLYDAKRFSTFKLSWLDLPMIVWCICPFLSSMTNGLGAYDGVSAVLDRTVSFGLPYLLGRLYLNDWVGLRQLAIGIFASGLIYAPLCILETIISPQLHSMVYGYHGIRQFGQGIRYGGYRPAVFMVHGLSVGMWMMTATLIGIWLWQAGLLKKFWNIPMNLLVIGMVITVILVKSTGAYIYLLYGIIILFTAKWMRIALPLLVLIAMIYGYVGLAASGGFSGESKDQIVAVITDLTNEDRAQSLQFRWDNEEILGEKARERPILGWGGWGRNRVFEYGSSGELEDVTVTDSLWIISFGVNGSIGLIAIVATLSVPVLVFCRRYPAQNWFSPKITSVAVLSVVLILYLLDCTLNNQPNPVFTLTSGGVAGFVAQRFPGTSQSKSKLTSAKIVLPKQSFSSNLKRLNSTKSSFTNPHLR
ncbi:MAG: O-antigen ligase family protein [Microcoleaceae cyanobacterium]